MAIERHYVRHLESLGVEVHQYPAHDIVYDFISANILNKVLYKTGIYTKYGQVNKALLDVARKVQPDIIWVFKGMEIFPDTLQELKKDFKLANYNPDHPFIISSHGSGNNNVTDSVGLYDLHLCYSRNLQQHIEEIYRIPTAFLPFGFELTETQFAAAAAAAEAEGLCFLGNPDVKRLETVLAIAQQGLPIAVYGHGWRKADFIRYPNVQVFDATYGDEFWIRLRQYRVQLNIFRKHNYGSHNMRSFEVPAVGGIQLTPYSKEQELFFEEGKEVFYYKDEQEMFRKIRKILEMSKEAADQIRSQARNRSLKDDHSYHNRASMALAALNHLLS